jgi:hypothetical protein
MLNLKYSRRICPTGKFFIFRIIETFYMPQHILRERFRQGQEICVGILPEIISFSLLLMERANANVSVLFILCWIFCSFLISYVRSLQAVVQL